MATSTPKLGLRKPGINDLVNVTSDLDGNADLLDAAYGAKKVYRTTIGSFTLNSTAWGTLSAAFDLSVKAIAGDFLEVGISAFWNLEATVGCLDVVSVVAAAIVAGSNWGAIETVTSQGIPAWTGPSGVLMPIGGGSMRQLLAGDIDPAAGNTVTCRLRYRTTSATAKTLFASADVPFTWWIINHGQP